MKIQLTDIRGRSRDLRLEGNLALEGFNDRMGAGRIRADVHVDPAGERWYLTARVEGSFPFICDRCGAKYEDEIEGEFSLVILSKSVRGLDEDENEEVILLPVESPDLDLTDQIRECMLLALPMQFLCREDCPGLDLKSEGNPDVEARKQETVDPRWGPLLDLKAKMDSEDDSASDERQE